MNKEAPPASGTGVKKKQRAQHCFVPGCKSGYRSSEQKRSLFSVLKDPAVFAQWQRNIPRADIRSLPLKQQLNVRDCFETAKRKSPKGMHYEQEWLLECILMRMKSPRLYRHLREHKILALPGPTTLRKYLSHYKSGFGFNPTTFAALKEKTADMTELELHGGLVLDEMKLSENISLRASGHAEGFVDLGPYTTNDQKGVPDCRPWHGAAVPAIPRKVDSNSCPLETTRLSFMIEPRRLFIAQTRVRPSSTSLLASR
ncbi:hypothetical protein ISCGN_001871 [Ixodes scapularis]